MKIPALIITFLLILSAFGSNAQDIRSYETFRKHVVILKNPSVTTFNKMEPFKSATNMPSNDVFIINFTTKTISMSGLLMNVKYTSIDQQNNSWRFEVTNPGFKNITIGIIDDGWGVYAEDTRNCIQMVYIFKDLSTKTYK